MASRTPTAGEKRKREVSDFDSDPTAPSMKDLVIPWHIFAYRAPSLKDLVIPAHIYDYLVIERREMIMEIEFLKKQRKREKAKLEECNIKRAGLDDRMISVDEELGELKQLLKENRKEKKKKMNDGGSLGVKEALREEKLELRLEKEELRKERREVERALERISCDEKTFRKFMESYGAVSEDLQREVEIKLDPKVERAEADLMRLVKRYARTHEKEKQTHIFVGDVGQLSCLKKLVDWCDFVHPWSIADETNLGLLHWQQIFSVPGCTSPIPPPPQLIDSTKSIS